MLDKTSFTQIANNSVVRRSYDAVYKYLLVIALCKGWICQRLLKLQSLLAMCSLLWQSDLQQRHTAYEH